MHVLTATSRTQGQRANDYTFAIDGELVRVDGACDRDRDDPDGGCGCGRGFAGMSSHRATTTALIRDLPMTPAEYERAYVDSLLSAGWLSARDLTDPGLVAEVHADVQVLLRAAALCPADTVVERRLDELRSRPARWERPKAS